MLCISCNKRCDMHNFDFECGYINKPCTCLKPFSCHDVCPKFSCPNFCDRFDRCYPPPCPFNCSPLELNSRDLLFFLGGYLIGK